VLLRVCIAPVFLLSACATVEPGSRGRADADRRIANLRRAAALPWTDDGRCVVREASNPWPALAERCFHALDHDRVRFRDLTGKCVVAAAPAIAVGVGICILAALEIAAQAVVVVGSAAVVAGAINEAIEVHERSTSRERPKSRPQARPLSESPPAPEPRLRPNSTSGKDVFLKPPRPTRPECEIQPVCPRPTKDKAHDDCADRVPPNAYPGCDVLVNGKRFDALQAGTRTLWEIKTYRYETYPPFVRDQAVAKNKEEFQHDQTLALACGYDFVVGVSEAPHAEALRQQLPGLKIVVTGCLR